MKFNNVFGGLLCILGLLGMFLGFDFDPHLFWALVLITGTTRLYIADLQ